MSRCSSRPRTFQQKGQVYNMCNCPTFVMNRAGMPPLHDSSDSLTPSGLQPGFQKLRSSNHLENSSSVQFSNLYARMFRPSSSESSITPSRFASLHSPAICRICLLASSGASKFLSQISCKSDNHDLVSLLMTSGIGRALSFFLNGHQPMSAP